MAERETFRARVKPLEWGRTLSTYAARGLEWEYVIRQGVDGQWYCATTAYSGFHEQFQTVKAAKAACQRDHDARVRALLVIKEPFPRFPMSAERAKRKVE